MTDPDPEVERIAELAWRAYTQCTFVGAWPRGAVWENDWRRVARAVIADRAFDETMHCSWCRAPFATARGTDCQHDVPARRKGTAARVASTWPQLRRSRAERMFAALREMIR